MTRLRLGPWNWGFRTCLNEVWVELSQGKGVPAPTEAFIMLDGPLAKQSSPVPLVPMKAVMIYPVSIDSFQAILRESFSWNCLGNGASPQDGHISSDDSMCSCLYIIVILPEMCTLAFLWRGHSSFTHTEPSFPISQVSFHEWEYFGRHISSVKHLDFYLLTDGSCWRKERQLHTRSLFWLPRDSFFRINHVWKSWWQVYHCIVVEMEASWATQLA